MTRAFVTGCTGTVGANLVAALNRHGVEVVGLQRATSPEIAVQGLDMSCYVGDILDIETLRPALEGVDWVFHVAAVADYWRIPAETIYRVNVEGARNVMQAALDARVGRFVLTGSTAALGMPEAPGEVLDEAVSFNLDPDLFPYGHSKYQAEQVMLEYVEKGLPAMAVLPSAVMGPRDLKFNSGELIVQALQGGFVPTPQGGLNFVDAVDCAEGHIAAAERGEIGERYLLAGENLTHRETLHIINQVLGTSAKPLPLPNWSLPTLAFAIDLLNKLGADLPVDKARVLFGGKFIYYDNSKARQDLGMTFRPFAESVESAFAWYLEHDYLAKRGISTEKARRLTDWTAP